MSLSNGLIVGNKRYKLDECHLMGGGSDMYHTVMSFLVYEDGTVGPSVETLIIDGEEHNSFWSSFDKDSRVYNLLISNKNIDNVSVESQSKIFLNQEI